MKFPDQLFLLLFLLLGLIFMMTMLKVKRGGGELFGKPTINIYAQFFSKFALIFPAIMFFLSLAGIHFPRCHLPGWTNPIGSLLFLAGMVLLYLSLWNLGRFTKMGLPKNDEIALQTSGIYRLSRNPMYFGLIILAVASTMLLPNLLNMMLTIAGILIHHRIILREEAFLEEKFGEKYREYKRRTRRYF
jgi:protein-S-isoprenylcysteine O-methyltransferase Ste14